MGTLRNEGVKVDTNGWTLYNLVDGTRDEKGRVYIHMHGDGVASDFCLAIQAFHHSDNGATVRGRMGKHLL